VRYQFIQFHQEQFSLAALCRVLAVSRGGYYAWKKRPPSARQQENEHLTQQIQVLFEENRRLYGSPRLWKELHALQIPCSEKRVARLMRLSHLQAVAKRRFVTTTDSDHDLPIAENVLDRQFEAPVPNTRWTTDITYVWTRESWLYLAVVLDLFSRRIVGWSMGTTLERSLVLSALDMALQKRSPSAGLLCHSDRGSQYASGDYRQRLKASGIVCSMSRKGNCWDNAPTESFFASFKKELVYRSKFATHADAKVAIFDWIEVFYNRKRRHSSLGYVSPEVFESQYQQHLTKAMAA